MNKVDKLLKLVKEEKPKPFKITALVPGKITPLQIAFLKSLGWKIKSGFEVSGKVPVEVVTPDRYSTYIVDKRWKEYEKKYTMKYVDGKGFIAVKK